MTAMKSGGQLRSQREDRKVKKQGKESQYNLRNKENNVGLT